MAAEIDKAKRSNLVNSLRNVDPSMKTRLRALKRYGKKLGQRRDLLWLLLILSASTQGNSRGWNALIGCPKTLRSIAYSKLLPLNYTGRKRRLKSALEDANVRMPDKKAGYLARNITKISKLGGVKTASKEMLFLKSRDEKIKFMKQFLGVGDKYGRNVWMDIYDKHFRDSIAVDERLEKIIMEIAPGLESDSYSAREKFFVSIAKDSKIQPWELDRLLYTYTDHFLFTLQGQMLHPASVI